MALNEIATVTISFDRSVPFAPYRNNKRLGAFIVIDKLSNETVGAGMIHFALRRSANEAPGEGRTLLLDAAFLVPRSRSRTFRALAAREARTLSRHGYGLTLTGPWPPYTFIQD